MKNMHKNMLIGALSLCICMTAGAFMSMDVKAEEVSGQPFIGMDADGNIYEVEPEAGVIEESDVAVFAESDEKLVNFNTRGDRVINYTEVGTNDAGYTNGGWGADGAYLGEEGGKVKFMLSGVIGLVDKGEVQIVNKSSAQSISYYAVVDGRLIHYITYNMNQSNNYPAMTKQGNAPSYLSAGVKYYSYDGHYFYREDQFGVMLSDYRAGHRNNSVNPNTPYYNYYQYLPMRSASAYSGGEMSSVINQTLDIAGKSNSKMRNLGESLVSSQNTYGVNALLVASHAAIESAWGTSNYALKRNNLFGINAVDSNPDDAYMFASPEACVNDYTGYYMSQKYLNPDSSLYWGGFWGDKASGVSVKYASNPYGGEFVANIAWNLDARGGNKDQYKYTIAMKDPNASQHNQVLIHSDSNAGSTAMYRSGTQSNTSFLLMNKEAQNGFYMIQSDGVLHGDRSGVNSNSGVYDFGKMYGFVNANSVVIVNAGGDVATGADRFMDVGRGDWYYENVKFVYERGIMTGLNSYTFAPAQALNRSQFATILYRMAGSPSVAYSGIFPDVPDGQFYSTPVTWAYQNKIITGYENGYFGTDDRMSREQMATLLYRYAKVCKLDTSDTADLGSFPDAGSVTPFAGESMKWAVGAGMIKGDQGKLNPQGEVNRATGATIITRYIQRYGL